jgi:hypothetical protein
MTITFNPASAAVGNVNLGSSGTLDVVITNSGGSPVTLSASSGTFSYSATTVPANNGTTDGSATVTITFTPPSVGSHTGTLSLGGQDCALSGTGVDVTDSQNRFHLYVPADSTNFVLGAGIENQNSSTYDGFGLTTTGTGYLNADTAIAIYSKKATYVAAGSGLFLGATIQNASSIDGVSGVASRAGIGFGLVDTAIALASGIRGIVNTAIGWTGSTWVSNAFGIVGAANALAATGLGLASFSAGVNSDISLNTAGITVYGEGGILMGTPAYCSVYALAGLVLGSLYPFMCGMDSEVYGLRTAALSGLTEATVQSLLKTTVQAAGLTGAGGEVEIKAGSKIAITAADAAKLAGKLDMEAGTSITANAKGHGLRIASDGARIGVWDAALSDTNRKDIVWVDKTSARVEHSKAVEVYSDAKISIWPAGKKTQMVGDASGWKVSGQKIKLG